jgi:diguanylate cyclase (GGDEF)-like protein
MAEIEHDQLLESVANITQQRDLESLELSLVKTLYEFVPANEIAIYRVQDNELHLAARADHDGVRGGMQVLGQGAFATLDDGAEYMDCLNSLKALHLETAGGHRLYHPIVIEGRAAGFLLVSCGYNRVEDLWFISGLMKIYQNFLAILNESERDKLTGLLNRKRFDDKLDQLLLASRAQAEQRLAGDKRRSVQEEVNWLAILDIDHFKRINDTFGHLYGDEVLLLLSQLMRKAFRCTDMLFRFGGEEFVVVLPGLKLEDVWIVLERFRKTVEMYHFPQVGQVTVSIGFVELGTHAVPATVVGHADQALYYAKRNGRNRICSYEALLEAGEIGASVAAGDVELF